VDPATTEFRVPLELLNSGDEIKFQILATNAGGNETLFRELLHRAVGFP